MSSETKPPQELSLGSFRRVDRETLDGATGIEIRFETDYPVKNEETLVYESKVLAYTYRVDPLIATLVPPKQLVFMIDYIVVEMKRKILEAAPGFLRVESVPDHMFCVVLTYDA